MQCANVQMISIDYTEPSSVHTQFTLAQNLNCARSTRAFGTHALSEAPVPHAWWGRIPRATSKPDFCTPLATQSPELIWRRRAAPTRYIRRQQRCRLV